MENHSYAPAEIEPYWQAVWREKDAFKIPNDIETLTKNLSSTCLECFPIPQVLDCTWDTQRITYLPMCLRTSDGCRVIT
jgi:hypothetical protein